MSVVYAAPPMLPPAPVSAWAGLTVTWAAGGESWTLSDPASGVFLHKGGVEGLSMPAHTAWTGSSPAVHGQYYRGHVVEPRRVFWPVHVYSDVSSDEWLERDRAFWASLKPGVHGVWTVSTPRSGSRSLACRFVDDGQHSFEVDPVARGWASYGVSLVADDPFWKGSPVRRTWAPTSESDFYGGGTAPVFNISSGSQLGSATMSNPGDVEAWPVWTITGPLSTVTVGVDGRTVVWDVALVAGDVLVIDTDPTVQSAWLNGVDVTGQLTSADFAPIPARSDVPLSLALGGTGSVQAEITPRHYKAW